MDEQQLQWVLNQIEQFPPAYEESFLAAAYRQSLKNYVVELLQAKELMKKEIDGVLWDRKQW